MGSSIKSRKTIIAKIFKKHGFKCFYCKRNLDEFEDYGFDHVIPKHIGGKGSIDNLVPACKSCNSLKHQYTIREWKEKLIKKRNETLITLRLTKRRIKTIEEDLKI